MRRPVLPILLLSAAALLTCRQPNRPPEIIHMVGPVDVEPGELYRFEVVVDDPDLDSVRCAVSWGDASKSDTSSWLGGIDTVGYEHTWDLTGEYSVHVRLWDRDGANAPRFFYGRVLCYNKPPPAPPSVDSAWSAVQTADTGVYVRFYVTASDINRDKVRCQFSWGDGDSSRVGPWLEPGRTWRAGHRWRTHGTFEVEVRAEDKTRLSSRWVGVDEVNIRAEPHVKWQVPLENPSPHVALYVGDGEVIVVNNQHAVRYSTSTGEEAGQLPEPAVVRGMAGRHDLGVFMFNDTRVWAHLGEEGWSRDFSQTPIGLALETGRLVVAAGDGCWFIEPGSGDVLRTLASPGMNAVPPLLDENRHLFCLGDSLRVFDPAGEPVGVYPGPSLVPHEFIKAPGNSFYSVALVEPERVAIEAFDLGGSRWFDLRGTRATDEGPNTPVIGADGRVVHIVSRDTLLALNHSGGSIWKWWPREGEVFSSGSPCIGGGGTVYVGVRSDSAGYVVAVRQGVESWRARLDSRSPLGMVLARDSVIYGVGKDANSLFAVYAAEGPASDPGWPMYRHDAGLGARVGGQ